MSSPCKENAMNAMTAAAAATHLRITVFQDSQARAVRVLDFAADYRPFAKEALHRAAAAHPDRAGCPVAFALELANVGSSTPLLVVNVLPHDGAGPGLLRMAVPVRTLEWIAQQMAVNQGLAGDYTMLVNTLRPDDPVVARWQELTADDDFELVPDEPPEWTLPSIPDGRPPEPARTFRDTGTFLRCAFTSRTLSQFLQAAAAERSAERGWLLCTRRHLEPGACTVVIEEMTEMPGETGPSHIYTRGRDFKELHDRLGRRLGGLAHLHPRHIDLPDRLGDDAAGAALDSGPAVASRRVELQAEPSGADHVVAWDLDAAADSPVVFPIASFGVGPNPAAEAFRCYGYADGLLKEITLLEVL
jgi:hypothetical protein